MKTIGSYEAKTHLSRLLDKVSKGARFTITKHGVPVALLVPAESTSKFDPRHVIQNLRTFRRNIRLRGLSLRDMVQEGRRF